LWIDDDRSIVLYATKFLATNGVEIDSAENIAAGLPLAIAGHYDLVLLDVRLPDGSGLDVLKAMRRAGITTPAIVLTGFGTDGTGFQAARLGAVAHHAKPLVGRALVAAIFAAMDSPHAEGAPVDASDWRPAYLSRSPAVTYPADSVLCSQGRKASHLVSLQSGLVKLVRSDGDRSMIVGFVAAGALLGIEAALNQKAYRVSAITIGECQTQFIDTVEIRSLLRDGNGAWLTRALSVELERMTAWLTAFGTLDLRSRLELLLAELTPKSSGSTREGIRLPPVTQSDLASAVGASREHVTRTLADIERDGLIVRRDRWIIVPLGSRLLPQVPTRYLSP
jgi:CRP-like cAMP-binding protein/ActR/RegA family two-component response regulator